MHVGILGGVGVFEPVEHGARLLRRGGIVEIDQRLAVNLERQRRKILADPVHIVAAVLDRGVHHACFFLARSHSAAAPISASFTPSCAIVSIASPTKAWISSASASACGMPRAFR